MFRAEICACVCVRVCLPFGGEGTLLERDFTREKCGRIGRYCRRRASYPDKRGNIPKIRVIFLFSVKAVTTGYTQPVFCHSRVKK